jgi:uncharacterized protein (DUF433 family)
MKRVALEEMAAFDPREVPLYWLSDVAMFTGVPESTVKRWAGQSASAKPLIHPPPAELQQRTSEARLSFSNLLETHILDAIRKRDIPTARIRLGLEYLHKQDPKARHPLLTYKLYSAPGTRDMFIRTLEGDALNVSRQGQRGLAGVLEEHLKRIEWGPTGPIRLMPLRSERVVIDLFVSGGQPVIRGTGVLASILSGRWRAGDSYEDLARDYALPLADVREAVRYIDTAAA